jgi:hypothetical protein
VSYKPNWVFWRARDGRAVEVLPRRRQGVEDALRRMERRDAWGAVGRGVVRVLAVVGALALVAVAVRGFG